METGVLASNAVGNDVQILVPSVGILIGRLPTCRERTQTIVNARVLTLFEKINLAIPSQILIESGL